MSEYDKEPLSRVEEILDETSSGTEYDKEPLSRVELRLKEVMAKIDGLVPDATVYKAGGSVTFANLPAPSKSTLGYVYDVSDAFTTTSDFKEGSGKKYPAGTNVAIVDIGTDENPIYKYDVLAGFIDMDNYVEKETGKGLSTNDFTDAAKNKLDELENYDDSEIKNDISDLSNVVADKVDKENGKSLSTNDYTDADKALVQDSPITVSATGTDLTLSTSSGNINALTVFGKSEVVDGSIKSAGEGYAVVRLADLPWLYVEETSQINPRFYSIGIISIVAIPPTTNDKANILCTNYVTESDATVTSNKQLYNGIAIGGNGYVYIVDKQYTTVEDFIASLGNATLCYQLADPTQGNTIAIKTDNGTGIDGTMAVFETGTPLRGIPDTSVRDVMTWDGNAGTVTKNIRKIIIDNNSNVFLWDEGGTGAFYVCITVPQHQIAPPTDNDTPFNGLSNIPIMSRNALINSQNVALASNLTGINILFKIPSASTVEDAKAYLQNNPITLIYELATPTTEQLTTTENASIAGLRTFAPQTHAQNNAGATMTVEAYAGTANGKAVAELKSALKITQSDTLTLTVVGWSSNQQTVTYEHDAGKRNMIDVEPANIKAWTAAGILATAETASTITFECDTAPTADLSFRVTSMEVR